MSGPGPLGLEILQVLVDAGGPLSVGDVLVRINQSRDQPLAYTTVMTVLGRMNGRYTVRRERVGRSYVYSASSADPAVLAADELMRAHGGAAVMHFLAQASEDEEMRERLRKLLS